MNINKVDIYMIKNKSIDKIIEFLNDNKHLKTEEVFDSGELNEMFEYYSDSSGLLRVLKHKIPEKNMFKSYHDDKKKYIFGHPKLIKILKENL